MKSTYLDLVQAYVRHGQESDLAAIAALRQELVEQDVPIEDLVGMHEQALLALKDTISRDSFSDFVIKTSTCFTELAIAYSLADQKKTVIRDEERRMDRERQRLEALGQMAGGVAHEFNNLLQPILGMAEMALEDAAPGGELAQQLSAILDCAQQAASIVRGILSTSRRQRATPHPIVLSFSLQKAVHFLSAILPPDIRLELAVSCDDERVLCEEGELSQVLLNLARNAGAAMQGKGLVRISLERWRRERPDPFAGGVATVRCLRLCVADSGAGMSADVAARAFQPFFTTKAPTEGTGLGLSIVMAIVQGWNGDLEIETAPGAGTRISLVLPIVDEPSTPCFPPCS